MKRLTMRHVTDFSDYTGGKDLSYFFKRGCSTNNRLSDIRLSPDGLHIHAIRRKPKPGLRTFDHCKITSVIQDHSNLDSGLTRAVCLLDLIYLDRSRDSGPVLALVLEDGKTEFWEHCGPEGGWNMLHTSDLSSSQGSKILSVCASASCIIWCEERFSYMNSSAPHATESNFGYSICTRTYSIEDECVRVGGLNILMHDNPCYSVITSGERAYLLPQVKENDLFADTAKVLLSWSLHDGSVAINSVCHGTLLRKQKLTRNESDFKVLMSECVSALSTGSHVEICACSPAENEGLLLLLSSGWVSILPKDGVMRQVYKMADNCLTCYGAHSSISMCGEVLALTFKKTLFLINVHNGLELEKICLKTEGILFPNYHESCSIRLLCESGLFAITPRDLESSHKLVAYSESLKLASVLVDAVFQEACRYYQQRSLNCAQLTVERLKSGEMFQAPIVLCSILKDYLSSQNTGNNPASEVGGNSKLLSLLGDKLQSVVTVEDFKLAVVRSSDRHLAGHCETLVQKEVSRLLNSEMDQESMLYLNGIFSNFPSQTWLALQSIFQLHCQGDGSLSAAAPPEAWKTTLRSTHYPARDTVLCAQPSHAATKKALPVFELLCCAIFRFQPCWLPRFVELAQQQANAHSSSSWGCLVKETTGSIPLYKRALSVLPENVEDREMEVELLLCSQRPNAVMQALWVLIHQKQWGRVTQVAQRFSRRGPLLNTEIFTALLCEVSQHRDLDPHLDLLWALCPEALTVISILKIVLKNLPSLALHRAPFPAQTNHLTIGLLKPLLHIVLQRETRHSARCGDILQTPHFPPPTPLRLVKGQHRGVTDRAADF